MTNTNPPAPVHLPRSAAIDHLRDTAQHVLDHWPPPPAVRHLVRLDPAILLHSSASTCDLLAAANQAEVARALDVGLRVGWALARSAEARKSPVR
jgi:hypothetical protein